VFKLKSNAKNTILSPGRYLGLAANNPAAQRELAHCPCPAKEDACGGVAFAVDASGQPETLVPEQVLAGFIAHLGGYSARHGLDPKLTMFAVPSFYT
jgi:hypothetical protein